jgi:IS4 transposase
MKLPSFEPVTQDELRHMWVRYPDRNVRRVLLEVERYRRLLKDIDRHYEAIHRSWHETVGGELVGLNMLKNLMLNERFRIPDMPVQRQRS